jgi:hypothetical protein
MYRNETEPKESKLNPDAPTMFCSSSPSSFNGEFLAHLKLMAGAAAAAWTSMAGYSTGKRVIE